MVDEKDLKKLKEEQGALDQSIALNKITMKLLHDRAADCKRLWIALIISILVNLSIVGSFLWYESQWDYTTTTTKTTMVTQDTGEGTGNNVYQSGENATYQQEASDTDAGGE